jgi:uncharacterized protein YbjQ (UPF0145 family)
VLVVTTEVVPGRETAEALGIVRGSTVRAKHLGADAVVAVRMETSQIQQAASEVVCYGTAVRLR